MAFDYVLLVVDPLPKIFEVVATACEQMAESVSLEQLTNIEILGILESLENPENLTTHQSLSAYSGYLVGEVWLSRFLEFLPLIHPPVIALVTDPRRGQQTIDQGAADYLELDNLIPEVLARSLRLCTQHYQQRLVYEQQIEASYNLAENLLAESSHYFSQEIIERQYSEAKFRAIFQRSPMGIALISVDRKVLEVNEAFCQILGYEKSELMGQKIRELTHPADLEVSDSYVDFLLTRELNYFTIEKRYRSKDDSYRWVQAAVAAVKDADKLLQYMVLLITDIQDQKQTELQLQYRLHLESIVTIVSQHLLTNEVINLGWIMEILGKAVECDRAYINHFTPNLANFTIYYEWCRPDLSYPLQQESGSDGTGNNKGKQTVTSYAHLYQNSPTAPYSEWLNTLKGNQDIVISNLQDLSPSPEKIRYEQNQCASCLEVPVFSSRGELWISLCFESTIPRNWFPEDAQLLRLVGEMICGHHERLQNQRELKASELLYSSIFNHSTDNIFLVQVHYVPDTTPKLYADFQKDISNYPQGIYFTYETINPAQERDIGMTAAEIRGKSPEDFLSSELAAWTNHQYMTCVLSGNVLTYEESVGMILQSRIYQTTLIPIYNESKTRVVKIQGSSRNITQIKQAEQEKIRKARYQNLITTLTLKIRHSLDLPEILETTVQELRKTVQVDRVVLWRLICDIPRGIVQQQKNYFVNEAVLPSFPSMLDLDFPGELVAESALTQFFQGQVVQFNEGDQNSESGLAEVLIKKSGDNITARLPSFREVTSTASLEPHSNHNNTSSNNSPHSKSPHSKSPHSKSPHSKSPHSKSYEEFLQHYQIRSALTLPIFIAPEPHSQNSLLPSVTSSPMFWGLLTLHQCHRSRAWESWEIESLQHLVNQLGVAIHQAQLLEQERRNTKELAAHNAELEEFTYIASHDLQVPLGTISNYAQLLQMRYGQQLDPAGLKFLQYIANGAQRIQALIEDLLLYTHISRNQKNLAPTDCNLVFAEACANLEFEINQNETVINYGYLPLVWGNHYQLVMLFQNLLSNSLKYRGESALRVSVDTLFQDGQWLFSFRDNGIGFDPQQSDRIFQIFQRLHPQQDYSGTGVGLAVCRKVIEFHGGKIWGESQPGIGAVFYFTLNPATSLSR
jgi:PAS domain S-box-containing protein